MLTVIAVSWLMAGAPPHTLEREDSGRREEA
jgi:hypothetical protein